MYLVASVRLSVCQFVCALLSEPFDLWPWFLAWGSTLTSSRLGLYYQSKVFVCVSVISGHVRIIARMRSIGFHVYSRLANLQKEAYWGSLIIDSLDRLTFQQISLHWKSLILDVLLLSPNWVPGQLTIGHEFLTIIIDREAREIMYLVVSVRLSVRQLSHTWTVWPMTLIFGM